MSITHVNIQVDSPGERAVSVTVPLDDVLLYLGRVARGEQSMAWSFTADDKRFLRITPMGAAL